MKIVWTKFARQDLFEIYKFYKDYSGKAFADTFKSKILESPKLLKIYPDIGQTEQNPALRRLQVSLFGCKSLQSFVFSKRR